MEGRRLSKHGSGDLFKALRTNPQRSRENQVAGIQASVFVVAGGLVGVSGPGFELHDILALAVFFFIFFVVLRPSPMSVVECGWSASAIGHPKLSASLCEPSPP